MTFADTLKNNPTLMDEVLITLSKAVETRPPNLSMQGHLHTLILAWVQWVEREATLAQANTAQRPDTLGEWLGPY